MDRVGTRRPTPLRLPATKKQKEPVKPPKPRISGDSAWNLQEVLFDFSRHPAAEDEGFPDPGGGEELQRVVDHGDVDQRQQSLSATHGHVNKQQQHTTDNQSPPVVLCVFNRLVLSLLTSSALAG